MTIPATAAAFPDPQDPNEELDWEISCQDLLEEDETIVSYELNVLVEAVALGLTIMSGSGRDHKLIDDNTGVSFWTKIDEDLVTDVAFNGAGVSLPVEILFVTNSVPARTRNRTFTITVAQL